MGSGSYEVLYLCIIINDTDLRENSDHIQKFSIFIIQKDFTILDKTEF